MDDRADPVILDHAPPRGGIGDIAGDPRDPLDRVPVEQEPGPAPVERLFRRFDAVLRDAGYLATGVQIVDATVVRARRPRLSKDG